jgi:hypothetical protein
MQKRKIYIPVILLCCLLFGGCQKKSKPVSEGPQYTVTKSFNKGPLSVQVRLSSEHVSLSDILYMEIQAQASEGYTVTFPALGNNLTQFTVRSEKDMGKKLSPDNKVIAVHSYQLEPMQTGECNIPELEFVFKREVVDSNGVKQSAIMTELINVTVATSIPQDANVTLADIEDVVDIKFDYFWVKICGTLAVLAGIGIAIYYRFRPKKAVEVKEIYRPAHEIAFEMLRRLAEEKLVEQGKIKEFYEKLSICLRQYIEDRFMLRAPEQTTEEFLEELRKSNILEPQHKRELKGFLEHCDLVKFAKYQPTNEQINESLTMAEKFVDNTKSQEQPDLT